MLSPTPRQPIVFLEHDTPFPDPQKAMGEGSVAPGLLAAGASLSVQRLQEAYSQGIFPWYSEGQPILWWSTDPRMVLKPSQFKLSGSLKKTIKRFIQTPGCEIKIDSSFLSVIQHCAGMKREGQGGTWIMPEMITAYHQLHLAGLAHSVETWKNGVLVGGLYLVSLGRAIFGESMFTLQTDASKIALSALVAFAKHHHIELIDCQQKTAHLSSLGGETIKRESFLKIISPALHQNSPEWIFKPIYWHEIVNFSAPT
jgi:leucyl/phenylalanyl-tRNA--protein transferase